MYGNNQNKVVMKNKEIAALCVIGVILGFLLGTIIGIVSTGYSVRDDAIAKGLAEYRANPITGKVKLYSLCTCKTNKLYIFDGGWEQKKE